MDDIFWKIANQWGISAVIVVAAALFFYRKVWPRVEQLIDTHLNFVASCDSTNKQQAESVAKMADGQAIALRKLDEVHKSTSEIAAACLRTPRDPPGWGVGNSRA